jgi:hypothetical protein
MDLHRNLNQDLDFILRISIELVLLAVLLLLLLLFRIVSGTKISIIMGKKFNKG